MEGWIWGVRSSQLAVWCTLKLWCSCLVAAGTWQLRRDEPSKDRWPHESSRRHRPLRLAGFFPRFEHVSPLGVVSIAQVPARDVVAPPVLPQEEHPEERVLHRL